MSTTLKDQLKPVLETLKNAEVDSYFRNYRAFPLSDSQINLLTRLVNKIRENSSKAFLRLDKCSISSEEQTSKAEIIIYHYERLFIVKSEISKFFDLHVIISSLADALSTFVSEMVEVKEFKYTDFGGIAAKEALKIYIEMGRHIRNSPDFKDSPLFEFEKITKDAQSYFDSDKNMAKFKVRNESVLDRTFIAIAAPSLEGKTQSAFVFKDVRPLYFIASPDDVLTREKTLTQNIYRNYQSVSKALLEFAKLDYDTIKNDGFEGSDMEFDKISATYLEEYHLKSNFWVLGFLNELFLDAKNNYDKMSESERPEWMDYHANRKDLIIKSASFEELGVSPFKGYCLFLDEFIGKIEIALIRNIARLLGLRCIVANTNAVIANLIGKFQYSSSRRQGKVNVWSIVITHLNPVSRGVMNNVFKIKELNERLLKKCADSERSKFKHFTDALAPEEGEIRIIRPGLVGIVIETIERCIQRVDVITIRTLIDEIVENLRKKIVSVKPRIDDTVNGRMANLCLYGWQAYSISTKTDAQMFNRKRFLADHLYYLKNPVCQGNFLFLTYDPENRTNCGLRIGDGNSPEFWGNEYTCFRYDDVLTALACMSVPTVRSISANLNEAIEIGDTDPSSVSNLSNPAAMSLDGNQLEVMSTFSIIDSSHHFFNSRGSSLSGQNGIDFLKNVLSSCFVDSDYLEKANLLLKFKNTYAPEHGFDIKKFLENLLIPFLCPFNCEIPDFLGKLSSNNPMDDSIHVGIFNRPSNQSRVDGFFDCYVKDENFSSFQAVIECKNWGSPLRSTDILGIIQRIMKSDGKTLSFIFCNSITEPNVVSQALSTFCTEKKVLLYRLAKSRNELIFSLVPCYCNEPTAPEMICFIIELNEIRR